MTLKYQNSVRLISEGRNLETLADTAKFIINDGWEVIYGLSFGDICFDLEQGFSTSGSRPHLGSPSDFRGVARLSTNFLKNDGIFKY